MNFYALLFWPNYRPSSICSTKKIALIIILNSPNVQDDGEAGIALVGINSEYTKYSEEYKKDEKTQSNIG